MSEDRKDEFFYRIFTLPKDVDIDLIISALKSHNRKKVTLQILNPDFIVSNRHIHAAIYSANKAIETGRNIARERANEFLLRLSGKRQITSALDIFGISEKSKHILIIAFGGEEKENETEINKFLELSDISEKDEIKKPIPITDLNTLCQYYQIDGNLEEIEKKAIENIAVVEIL